MTYYIKPSTVFLIHMIDRVLVLLILIAAVAFIAAIVFVWVYNDYFDPDKEEQKRIEKFSIKMAKICAIIGTIATLMSIFTPSKKVLTEMYVASVVTKENVDSTKQEVIEIIDHIIDRVEEGENDNH